MKLSENFNQQEFIDWISSFLPDFYHDVRKVDVSKSSQGIKSIQTIGESAIGVRVYIIETDQDPSRRKVGLATESFSLLRDYGTPNAIIAYHCGDSTFWRLSLLTSTLSWDEGKINKKLSNPKRQSYILGSKAKVKTPHQYLIAKGSVVDIKDLKNRFSLEVVNKEFYKEISHSFIALVGGTLTKGKSKEVVKPKLKLPSVGDYSQTAQEFVVRLIGRVIFNWFLREKKSSAGHSLMPHDLLSLDAAKSIGDYYHTILEPIFFEVLNKKINTRKEIYTVKPFSDIPYLNGGLFAPHDDDHYSYNDGKQAINHNLVIIPDSWFVSFFEILETYNFTIDENTSFDEELSIDPEMLGRIFENLLAEINPETGESARKSTGSYYTPRVIVDYMVDESLYLYLKDKTSITENKLRSVISYDLDDDSVNPLTDEEKDKITQALQSVKILDPACGSGAFPIGALQKIVFILQQIDPHGQIWFNKQIQNTSIELRRLIQKEFEEKNFDYLRKLGVIRENIYGVDIQPIATEISRLRCFLTLVVDQRVDDSLLNRGIEPLPNLDFKFVTANTLIGLPKTELAQGGLFEDRDNIDKLSEVRSLYFSASSDERAELKNKFVEIQNDMLNTLVREHRPAELTEKLATWKPFSHQQTIWFDPVWMFGIKDGFDIIISNPPYISYYSKQAQKLDSNTETYLRSSYSFLKNESKKVRINSAMFFMEFGLWALSPKGILSYIVDLNVLENPFAKTRKIITEKSSIKRIVTGLTAFENIGSGQIVLILENISNNDNKIIFKNGISGSEYVVSQNVIIENNYSWADHSKVDLLSKIELNSRNLSTLVQIHTGVAVYATEKGKAIFIKKTTNKKTYPLLLGGKSVPFSYCKCMPMAYLNFDKELENQLNNEFDNDYFNRKGSHQRPFNLRKITEYYRPKIVLRQSDIKLTATYSDDLYFGNYSLFNIYDSQNDTALLKYLIALINSKLLTFYGLKKDIILVKPGKTPQIRSGQRGPIGIRQLPIRIAQADQRLLLINKVNQILDITNKQDYDPKNPPKEQKELEAQIDKIVYELYGLSEEEIKLIENEK